MKRFSLVLAMLAILLVFGLALVSCDDGSTGSGEGGGGGTTVLSGTSWEIEVHGAFLSFSETGSTFTRSVYDYFYERNVDVYRGTYTISGITVTCTITWDAQINNSSSRVGQKLTYTIIDENTLKSDANQNWYKQ